MIGCSNFYTVNYNVMVSSLWVIRTLYMPYGSPLSEYDLQEKQDRQRTYNATLFVEPFLLWKSNKYQIFWVCVCSLRYLACNVHVPYCHLCPVWVCHIFPHYLIKGVIKKKVIDYKMCVLIFSTTFVCNISHSKINSARHDQKPILVLMQSTIILFRF